MQINSVNPINKNINFGQLTIKDPETINCLKKYMLKNDNFETKIKEELSQLHDISGNDIITLQIKKNPDKGTDTFTLKSDEIEIEPIKTEAKQNSSEEELSNTFSYLFSHLADELDKYKKELRVTKFLNYFYEKK